MFFFYFPSLEQLERMEPSGADGGFPEPLDGQYGGGKAKNVNDRPLFVGAGLSVSFGFVVV